MDAAEPKTQPDTLVSMNQKLDHVLAEARACKGIAQQCLDAVLVVKAQHTVPIRTRVLLTFAGAAAGGFLASLAANAIAAQHTAPEPPAFVRTYR